MTSREKVHAVDVSPSVRIVGLELSASTIGSSQMIASYGGGGVGENIKRGC